VRGISNERLNYIKTMNVDFAQYFYTIATITNHIPSDDPVNTAGFSGPGSRSAEVGCGQGVGIARSASQPELHRWRRENQLASRVARAVPSMGKHLVA
jgi:hypothetical protein